MAERRAAPRFFVNGHEKAAFWACVAGLALVLGTTLLRLSAPRPEPESAAEMVRLFEAFASREEAATQEIARLRADLAGAEAVIDSLGGRQAPEMLR